MALAKLTIDLEARLAGLQQGLDKAGLMAQANAERIQQQYANVTSSINTALKTIGVGFVASSLVSFVKAANAGLLAIKDLSEATGATYENISGLEHIALKAGGSFEDMSQVVIKLNTSLKDAGRNKELGRALKDIGLDVNALRAMDPAQAVLEVAKALEQFEDDGARARKQAEIFGKGVMIAAPLLREFAEAGQLNATVTKEQVLQADLFNKELARLSTASTEAARTLSGPVVSAMNATIAKFREGTNAGKSFWQTLQDFSGTPLGDQWKSLILGFGGSSATKGVDEITTRIERLRTVLATNIPDAMRKGIEKDIAHLNEQLALTTKLERDGAFDKYVRGDKDRTPVPIPRRKLRDSDPETEKKKAKPNKRELFPYVENKSLTDALRAIDQTDPQKLADLQARLKELLTLQSGDLPIDGVAEAIAKTRDELDKLDPWLQKAAESKKALDAVLAQTPSARLDEVNEDIKRINEAYAFGEINAKKWGEAILVVNENLKGAKDTGEDVGAKLGLLFSSAAGEAITHFKDLRGVLKGVLADIAQLLIVKPAIESLQKAITTSGLGNSLIGLFSFGGARAGGGPVSAGVPYLVGEKGPELFMPRNSGSIVPNGTGGGITVNYGGLYVGSNVSRNEVVAAMETARRQAVADIAESRRRGYAMA